MYMYALSARLIQVHSRAVELQSCQGWGLGASSSQSATIHPGHGDGAGYYVLFAMLIQVHSMMLAALSALQAELQQADKIQMISSFGTSTV